MWLQEAFWIFALLGVLIWFFRPYLNPIGGLWLEVDGDGSHWDLMQVGPWVVGEQRKENGLHKFGGRYKGGQWHIARRDEGRALFEAQGFPGPIALQLSGRVLVTYKLNLQDKGKTLAGSMTPIKVVFVKVPPQISDMTEQAPQPIVLTKKPPL